MKDHLQYAVDLALTQVNFMGVTRVKTLQLTNFHIYGLHTVSYFFSQAPPSEPKSEPDMSLYLMVQEANTVWHLFEKQFNDDLMPLTAQSPKHAEAVQQRKTIKVAFDIWYL